MRILSTFLLLTLGLFYGLNAQVDVSTARANPKTFIFDDDKHTVHGYIYSSLKEKSSCCGNDAIYLEVKFDASGVVTSAKTLTGKNECYKKSVVDVVKSVRWDATGVSGSKTIYFEVKPIIPCSGSPGENEYKPIAIESGAVATTDGGDEESSVSSGGDEETTTEETTTEETTTEETVAEETTTEETTTEETTTEETVAEETTTEETTTEETTTEETVASTTGDGFGSDDGFLSDDGGTSSEESSSTEESTVTVETGTIGGNTTTTTVRKSSGPVKIPPQAKDIEYVSKGERRPDESHSTTFANVRGQVYRAPKYQNEQEVAIHIRKQLREAGFCGLAQAAIELEIDPSGKVVNSRILSANNPKVSELVPSIVSNMKFPPQGYARNYYSYHQFKTEIVCKGEKPKYDLDQVPNIIKVPESGNP